LCEDAIVEGGELDMENCVEVFNYADLHGAFKLKKMCFEFIQNVFGQILTHHPATFEKMGPKLLEGTGDLGLLTYTLKNSSRLPHLNWQVHINNALKFWKRTRKKNF
jgi:hypothetical protein